MKLIFATLALTASAACAAGCSTESASGAERSAPTAPLNDESGSSGAVSVPTTQDAAPSRASQYRGNPLCYVGSAADCMPDDDAYHQTTGTQTCATPAPDAGDAGAAGTAYQSLACRIGRDSASGSIGTVCEKTNAVTGGDGASCDSGADCAAGFDCIGGEKGTKACRHYCCAGTCKDQASQSGGATFCDIQSLVDVNQKAPVCMPLKRCKLLGTGECSANESCAVVTEAGDTGCVTVGEQQISAPCDEEHCAANLTCLGKAGARKCFKLCKVNSNDCGASEICATSTVFKDPSFGICQKP